MGFSGRLVSAIVLQDIVGPLRNPMKISYICALSLLILLGGCSLGDLFGSGSEELRVRSYVRDELDRVEAERGPRRRQYIDERVSETVAATDKGDMRLSNVEETLGRLKTDLSIVARKVEKRIELGVGAPAGSSAGPAPTASVDPEELSDLRADIDAALRSVSKLNADQEAADARSNARFERLEFRTSELSWPHGSGERGLHLASYRTHEAALAGWELLRTEFPDLLSDEDPVFFEVDTVAGLFVRLMVGVGRNQRWLTEARNKIRAEGEYAMIMPLPSAEGPVMQQNAIPTPKKLIPGS